MHGLCSWYFRTSLVLRIFGGFLLGSAIGGLLWWLSAATGRPIAVSAAPYVSPFGGVFVNMLKMIVIPVVFFSLIVGAAHLPIRRFGRVGAKVMGWYLLTSVAAALVGVFLALAIDPGSGTAASEWKEIAFGLGGEAELLAHQGARSDSLAAVFLNMFKNPFEALAGSNFLPIIVFSILFGLAIRVTIEAREEPADRGRLERLVDLCLAARDATFKMVDWILEYAPVGVLALSLVNFGVYGPKIVGPYIGVVLGVVAGVLVMILAAYSLLILLVARRNPFRTLHRIREAMLTAFVTRSSAATLPVSIKVATQELGVQEELSSFSLPLGATVNMDGVCIHLPMFAVLAANMFGLPLTTASLFVLVITTVLAAVGAGGVPGGSLMLLFIVLEAMGLGAEQVAVIVALALGVNPILDMFETMNNVTGDIVCTYVVAEREGLVSRPAARSGTE